MRQREIALDMRFPATKTQGVQLVSDLLSLSTLDDPYACYAQLRVAGPVHRVAGTDFYLATTWDAVQEAVSRPEIFSSNLTATLVTQGTQASTFDMGGVDTAGHVLATGDDPRHAHERKLVLPALVAKRIRALEPAIADIARQLWLDAAVNGRIEWMSAIGDRLPMTLVARLIGLPDGDVPQLVQWGYGSTELLSGVFDLEHIGTAVETSTQLAGYLYTKFAEAQTNPGDDLLGDLARAVADGAIATEVAVLMLIQLVGAVPPASSRNIRTEMCGTRCPGLRAKRYSQDSPPQSCQPRRREMRHNPAPTAVPTRTPGSASPTYQNPVTTALAASALVA